MTGRNRSTSTVPASESNPTGRPFFDFKVGELLEGCVKHLHRQGALLDVGSSRCAWLSFQEERQTHNIAVGDKLKRLPVIGIDEKRRRVELGWPERRRADKKDEGEDAGWEVQDKKKRSRSLGAALGANTEREAADHTCPICVKPKDADDLRFEPCQCGFAVCVWCVHRIREETDRRCPACRREYDEERLRQFTQPSAPTLQLTSDAEASRRFRHIHPQSSCTATTSDAESSRRHAAVGSASAAAAHRLSRASSRPTRSRCTRAADTNGESDTELPRTARQLRCWGPLRPAVNAGAKAAGAERARDETILRSESSDHVNSWAVNGNQDDVAVRTTPGTAGSSHESYIAKAVCSESSQGRASVWSGSSSCRSHCPSSSVGKRMAGCWREDNGMLHSMHGSVGSLNRSWSAANVKPESARSVIGTSTGSGTCNGLTESAGNTLIAWKGEDEGYWPANLSSGAVASSSGTKVLSRPPGTWREDLRPGLPPRTQPPSTMPRPQTPHADMALAASSATQMGGANSSHCSTNEVFAKVSPAMTMLQAPPGLFEHPPPPPGLEKPPGFDRRSSPVLPVRRQTPPGVEDADEPQRTRVNRFLRSRLQPQPAQDDVRASSPLLPAASAAHDVIDSIEKGASNAGTGGKSATCVAYKPIARGRATWRGHGTARREVDVQGEAHQREEHSEPKPDPRALETDQWNSLKPQQAAVLQQASAEVSPGRDDGASKDTTVARGRRRRRRIWASNRSAGVRVRNNKFLSTAHLFDANVMPPSLGLGFCLEVVARSGWPIHGRPRRQQRNSADSPV